MLPHCIEKAREEVRPLGKSGFHLGTVAIKFNESYSSTDSVQPGIAIKSGGVTY